MDVRLPLNANDKDDVSRTSKNGESALLHGIPQGVHDWVRSGQS